MKLVRFFLTVVMILIAIICNSIKVEAGDFDRVFCLQVGDVDLIKLVLTKKGSDDTFLVNGTFFAQDGRIEALCGGAVASEDKIYITLNSDGEEDSKFFVYINRLILDRATLNGIGEGMGIVHDKNNLDPDHVELDYCSERTLTYVSCP